MTFEIFAQQVHARFNALSKHELFDPVAVDAALAAQGGK